MKKYLRDNSEENTFVEIIFRGSNDRKYKCFGILVREEENSMRVAFNAADDQVIDYLDIPTRNIHSLNVVDGGSFLIEK